MKRNLFLILTVAVGVALFGCSDDDDNGTGPGINEFEMLAALGDVYFTDYVTDSGKGVNTLASAVYANLTDGNTANDPYILDWRKAEHFALGHIEGAQQVSLADFNAVVDAIPAGKTVLNVCYTGQSASYATSAMNMMGIEAQNLKFGMCGWTSDTAVNLGKWDAAISDDYADWLVDVASTATQTYDPPVLTTGKETGVEILKERMALAAANWKKISVADLYADFTAGNADDYFVVNYFAPPQYEAGHIPGAVRFQPKQDFQVDQKLFNLPTDKKIVVYCFTGQTSAQVVSYLNALGYEAYSLLYGVNAICHTNDQICTTAYHVADTDYPVVTGN